MERGLEPESVGRLAVGWFVDYVPCALDFSIILFGCQKMLLGGLMQFDVEISNIHNMMM